MQSVSTGMSPSPLERAYESSQGVCSSVSSGVFFSQKRPLVSVRWGRTSDRLPPHAVWYGLVQGTLARTHRTWRRARRVRPTCAWGSVAAWRWIPSAVNCSDRGSRFSDPTPSDYSTVCDSHSDGIGDLGSASVL